MIRLGLEVLLENQKPLLQYRRAGLVTHPAAVTADLWGAAAALQAAGVNVTALFGPEHGLRGTTADGIEVANALDERTGLPVFSLYGTNKEPTAEMLAGVDVLLFDMQDVGVRFYTYLSTLVYVLRGAAKAGKAVIVLDRPNPITGALVEGPGVEPGFESFVGIIPIPLRHGLTLGELARWVNARQQPQAELSVVAMRGWQRAQWFDQTGRVWVSTSPAMPHLSTATVYPGTCLLEGTTFSEGRGTALPFEILGAPGVDGWALAARLNSLHLPGVIFRPTEFTPMSSKHHGQECAGVQLHVTDRSSFRPFSAGLHVLAACRRVAPEQFAFLNTSWEGRPPHFDLLMGSARVRQMLEQGADVGEIESTWRGSESAFWAESRPCRLYD